MAVEGSRGCMRDHVIMGTPDVGGCDLMRPSRPGAGEMRVRQRTGTFRSQIAQYVGVADLAVGMFKGLVFGWLVALIATFHGYRAAKKDGAEGVGIATNRAIVHGAVMCILLNLVISWLLYG